ncbi:hypothetical protein MUK70_11750 [Dyadobacter chenwenxiniae]|uniref:Uncharacterized protein n=1 Tax=Dyadobacter chenwenxiniae TaxID=2906456 RepID=A0A9X1PGQ4_9BACT|nr:hypothetical protein [Dyadobacter chenwenxiniae]MCF0059915.1 hypothetical protein [Dyadobacter chenwenxiniae]UON85654.1 hypothetical protein MUK70_11750 [Dyadobacter chenwenxiniae]
MKTFHDCRDEIARGRSFKDWGAMQEKYPVDAMFWDDMNYEAAELYAKDVAQDALNRAAEKLINMPLTDLWVIADKDAIKTTSILTK